MSGGAEAWVRLNRAALEPRKVTLLLQQFGGDPEAVLTAARAELARAGGISARSCDRLAEVCQWDGWPAEQALLERLGASVLTFADAEYPPPLRQIYDPPPVLYVRGSLREEDRYAVAVVGTRQATPYGRNTAFQIARQLARAGVTVVSGMARGIDAQAHRGALSVGGRTIAVLGCGVDQCYPPEHARLRDEIAASGAVVSEFPLGSGPERWNFVRRNRIISGLSLGVLLVEAPGDSGAIKTADFALEQGREVFAVPGNVDVPTSRGCNLFIKQQGAALVENAADILDALNLATTAAEEEPPAQPALPLPLSPGAERVLALLGPQQKHVDAIAAESALPLSEVLSALTLLEMSGSARRLPGNYYVRLVGR